MTKILIAALLTISGAVWAQSSEETVAGDTDEVDLYISVIENIDVTAEKTPLLLDDDLDADVATILDEVDALEDHEESE